MDKVVDHILVFKGQGDIHDFPGNYTQYRAYESANKTQESSESYETNKPHKPQKESPRPRKLSFKEKQLMAQLEADIERLEAEKKDIEAKLSGGAIEVSKIVELSKRLPLLNEELDEKSMQWLELSEI